MTRSLYRFHYPGPSGLAINEEILLPEGESRHLSKVLRLAAGAQIEVFDTHGVRAEGEVAGFEGNHVRVKIRSVSEPRAEGDSRSNARLHVAVSLLKHRAMDWMIEKLCELDAASLQPLICKRTVVAPKDADATHPPERWDRIALAAAKQSGRDLPMRFEPITPLEAWLAREHPPALRCFAHTGKGAVGLGEWLSGRAGMGLPVLVAIGPEGGWTPEEIEAFEKAGFAAVGLGPLILRAETAALTVAAACRVML